MPFSAIPGHFHLLNYSPDGDSLRFEPTDRTQVQRLLGGRRARFNPRGHVQLRIEAIDTLETHFTPPSGGVGSLHQPQQLAQAATNRLLEYLGFELAQVVWDAQHRNVVAATPSSMPGFILARSVEKNGRPVAFVFHDDVPRPANDDAGAFLDVALLERSYNYLALQEGHAYPTFYEGLFAELRLALTQATAQARAAGHGVFGQDRTTAGVEVASLAAITDQYAILPKLFRRLSDYIVSTGGVAGFKDVMSRTREKVLDLRTNNFTHFDTFIERSGNRIALARLPEELVFEETQPQPGPALASLLATLHQPEPDAENPSELWGQRRLLTDVLTETRLTDLL